MALEPHKLDDIVLGGKSGDRLRLVFVNASYQIVRNTKVYGAMLSTRGEIDVIHQAQGWIPGSLASLAPRNGWEYYAG